MFNKNKDRRHSGGAGAGEILAGFVFLPAGLLLIIFIAIPKSYDALSSDKWIKVQAELVEVDKYEYNNLNTDNTRYDFLAKYQYKRQGKTHFYYHTYYLLKDAQQSPDNSQTHTWVSTTEEISKTTSLWVNTETTNETKKKPGINWTEIVVMWLVPSIFCLLGYLGLRHVFKSGKAPEGETPWLANPKWRDNVIYSGSRSKLYFYWSATIILTIVGFIPMTGSNGNATLEIRLIAIFPFNILLLASVAAAVKASRQWWRYGASPLTLDPFPGAIGGDVAGEILLRIPYSQNIKAEVQLTATRNDARHNKHGTTVEWQKDGYASATEKDGHIALQFRFAVPDGLPQSDISYKRRRYANRYYEWTLNVTVETPQDEIKREYEIPVYPTAQHSSIIEVDTLQEDPFANSQHAAHQILPKVQHQGAETTLKFPMRGKTNGMLFILYLGTTFIFLGMLSLLSNSFDHEILSLAATLPIISGLIIIGYALYRHLNTLRVQFTGNIVISERLLLGIALRSHFVSYYDIKVIVFNLAPGTKKGASHQAEYVVCAVTNKGNIVLAERIEGHRETELVCEHLRKLTRLDERLAAV